MSFTILYEDKRGPVREFGLHRFITQCVFDSLNGHFHVVSGMLQSHACNGDSKLLEKCRNEADLISPNGCPIIAVFDNDQIRRSLRLIKSASDLQVVNAILAGKTGTAPVCVALLKENTESVLQAIAGCWDGHNREVMRKAIDKKDRISRDIVFRNVSTSRLRAVRDCVLATNPSVRALVDGICNLIRAALTSPGH